MHSSTQRDPILLALALLLALSADAASQVREPAARPEPYRPHRPDLPYTKGKRITPQDLRSALPEPESKDGFKYRMTHPDEVFERKDLTKELTPVGPSPGGASRYPVEGIDLHLRDGRIELPSYTLPQRQPGFRERFVAWMHNVGDGLSELLEGLLGEGHVHPPHHNFCNDHPIECRQDSLQREFQGESLQQQGP
jgi:hypothetical protein